VPKTLQILAKAKFEVKNRLMPLVYKGVRKALEKKTKQHR